MSDIYEKIGSGINKIQGNLQSSQSISQYKKVIQEASLKRTEILIQLGEEVYKKFRVREIESEELKTQVSSLIELDQKIYQSQLAIAELYAQSKEHSCPQCGAPITEGDRSVEVVVQKWNCKYLNLMRPQKYVRLVKRKSLKRPSFAAVVV